MPEEPNDELWEEREQENLCVYCGEFEEVYNGICGNCFAEFARRAGQSPIPPVDQYRVSDEWRNDGRNIGE